MVRYAVFCRAASWADQRLQRGGRCHESEVYAAFRRQHALYRRPDSLPDATLRDMLRNWYPDVDRTRTGYLKNCSLKPGVDAFTGQATGTTVASAARLVAAPGAADEAQQPAAGSEASVSTTAPL